MRPIAILFDLDGTLLDTLELLLGSMRHAFAEREGLAPTTEEWIAGIGTPLRTQLRPFAESDEDVERVVERYRGYQLAHHDRLLKSYADVHATLELLHARGHPLGVVTSKMNDIMHRGLDHVGIAHLISVAIGCDSCSKHKPDPEPVLVALRELGYEPHEAVYVGDSPHDMYAGRAAGVITIAALWGLFTRQQLEEAQPDYWIERITDLPPLIQRLAVSD
jgi:pyrophosphatase PpaX